MYITNNNTRYPCKTYNPIAGMVKFSGVEGLILPITGLVQLCRDDGFILAKQNSEDFVRQIYENGTLILTNTPEPVPHVPTVEELRELALQRISGKCSASVKKGLDIEGKHYSFSQLAQTDIAGCMQELRNGASVVPYRADGEVDYSPYNLEQMTVIYTTMSEWIKVNTQYKAMLKKWIARKENKDVLNSIDYGVMLPDDLLQELGTQLEVYGVDISKYVAMLGGGQE